MGSTFFVVDVVVEGIAVVVTPGKAEVVDEDDVELADATFTDDLCEFPPAKAMASPPAITTTIAAAAATDFCLLGFTGLLGYALSVSTVRDVNVQRRSLFAVLTVAVLVLSACGHSSSKSATKVDASYSPQKSLADAVTAMLQDEQKSDHNESFKLLAPDARTTYKDAYDWTKRRQELPVVTGFKLESAKGTLQPAVVNHTPGIDPFIGLSPGSETQNWVGKKVSNGWLLEADPATDPILPSDASASTAVTSWVQAVQACDKDKAHALQAIPVLIASSTPALCGVAGNVSVSAPTKLTDGPDSADIVAQYSTDSLQWARTVAVTSPSTFHVVVAPIGTDWRVLAIY